MNKQFIITYEVVGGKRTDNVTIWSDTIMHAVEIFTKTDMSVRGLEIKYTEYAIKNIEC